MDRDYGNARYKSRFVSDNRQGFAGLELNCKCGSEQACVARLLYWDSCGRFYFETFSSQIPLEIVEELISEAKSKIKTA